MSGPLSALALLGVLGRILAVGYMVMSVCKAVKVILTAVRTIASFHPDFPLPLKTCPESFIREFSVLSIQFPFSWMASLRIK